jgi:hypothetical protein
LVGDLAHAVLAEHGHRVVVDRDDAGPAALGRAVNALAVDDAR